MKDELELIEVGWRYSPDQSFRQRFPVAYYDEKEDGCTLAVECANLIDGRWEHFISNPNLFWTPDGGWERV